MMKDCLVAFLDTQWHNADATLYYNGYIYWCEGYREDDGIFKFFVSRWKVKNEADELYHTYCGQDLEPLDYSVVFKEKGVDMDLIKKHFLEAKIFDGKSFWEVENDLLWLEDSGEDIVVGNGEVL